MSVCPYALLTFTLYFIFLRSNQSSNKKSAAAPEHHSCTSWKNILVRPSIFPVRRELKFNELSTRLKTLKLY